MVFVIVVLIITVAAMQGCKGEMFKLFLAIKKNKKTRMCRTLTKMCLTGKSKSDTTDQLVGRCCI